MPRQYIGKIFCLVVAILLLLSLDNFAYHNEGLQQENKPEKAKQDKHNDKEKKDNRDDREEEKVSLSVKVKDRDSSDGIKQAQVTVIEGSSSYQKKTDKDGIAQFSGISKGTVTIRVVVKDYKTAVETRRLEEKQNSIEIKPDKDTP